MGKSQRDKGATWEREVANRIRERTGWPTKRGLGQARSGGEVADVDGLPGWWIECKVGAHPPTTKALEQAEAASPPGTKCVAIVKKDRHEPMAVFRLGSAVSATMTPDAIISTTFDVWISMLPKAGG